MMYLVMMYDVPLILCSTEEKAKGVVAQCEEQFTATNKAGSPTIKPVEIDRQIDW